MKLPVRMSCATLLMVAALSSPSDADITVGIVGPLTGGSGFVGEQMQIGAIRAIEDINAAGGVLGQQMTAMLVDDACDPAQAEAAARQLVSAGVVFVNGHACSGASMAASSIYDAAGIIMMSPASTNPRVTDDSNGNVFRVIGRDDIQALVAASLIGAEFSDRNLAVVHGTDQYAAGLASGLIEELALLGISPDLVEPIQDEAATYVDLVERLVAAEIQVLYMVHNFPRDMGLIARQARESLPNLQLISSDALTAEDYLLVAGEAGIGTLFTFGPDARDWPTAAEVVQTIRDQEYFEPIGYTLYSYAVMQVWAQAVEAAGSFDSPRVMAALRSETFDTILGAISFDRKGDVVGIDGFVVYEMGAETYSLRN